MVSAQGPSSMMGGGDAGGFMSGISPLGLMAAGGLLSAPQQYVQQRMGWLKTNMTGGTMSALFNITPSYVSSKVLMLLAPFLGRWTYTRANEQIAGGQKYRPPAADVNAPDLFVPLMAAWTYALLNCVLLALRGKFRPEAMSNMVYGTCVAWGVHWVAAWLVLRAMSVPGVPWSELLAYTGYPFVSVCISVAAQQLGGRAAYYAAWGYGSLCMGVFMVRTMKRVIFQETRQYGGGGICFNGNYAERAWAGAAGATALPALPGGP
ncbi:Protein transport protein yif1 [Monoraphidium neglectum]|uniref:Protein transport protein yif1 n=1 Tax=Monoraphidium neglectum TaxID=145388 RepID=A0A0D2MJM9_9CHLO|nr:Protein transport protein yif1 [Monoraphidium neglectum]KIZ00837.1 Protein transport protein yif1 [Monoraphidium neglectum]|eukprot:XP_013899856.1 Protein transport protein yif1 [Monoraphidium neglectum]